MHFLAATTIIFSCSHCCFLAERKNSFFGKVLRSLNPCNGWSFFGYLQLGGRLDPLSKMFGNNATDLKLGSDVELPWYSRLMSKLVT